MKRLNFTIDDETVDMLDQISNIYYHGNKSLTVRAALESLATHLGHAGWVISGYAPAVLDHEENCHSCGQSYPEGNVLYRPCLPAGQRQRRPERNPPGNLARLSRSAWKTASPLRIPLGSSDSCFQRILIGAGGFRAKRQSVALASQPSPELQSKGRHARDQPIGQQSRWDRTDCRSTGTRRRTSPPPRKAPPTRRQAAPSFPAKIQ